MKQILIIRHAKSDWGDAAGGDFQRQLSPRGVRDLAVMAERLQAVTGPPDIFYTSPAARALATAQGLLDRCRWPADCLHPEPALYLADTATLFTVIHGAPEECALLALCGHNPGLTSLLNTLCGPVTDNLPTLGAALIQTDAALWSDVQARSGDLLRLEYPKKN